MMRALLALALCTGWSLNSSGVANAQTYPKKEPVKIVVPFPPGGPTDGMARIISERLGAVLGQTIVIENRGGAGGGIGGKFVAAANPDGYTLLMTPGGALTSGPAVQPQYRLRPGQGIRAGRRADRDAAHHFGQSGPAGEVAGRGRSLRQGQSGQAHLGIAGFRHRAASARRNVQARSRRQHPARAISRNGAVAQRDSGQRRCRSSPIPAPPACHTSRLASFAPSRSLAKNAIRNCPTCRPWSRRAFPNCSRLSGSP